MTPETDTIIIMFYHVLMKMDDMAEKLIPEVV